MDLNLSTRSVGLNLARRFNAGIVCFRIDLVASATTEHHPSLRDGVTNDHPLPGLEKAGLKSSVAMRRKSPADDQDPAW